jgi:putative redox protein
MSAIELRQLYEQQARVLKRHPSLGKASVQASVKLVATTACEARRRGHVTRVDLPFEEGGTDSGPTPGDLMRASLGACMAMSYRNWAARLGVDLRSVEVDVTCEFDARGQLGISDDVPVGWERLLLEVRIVSAAPPSDVRRVVEVADRLSPMLANLSPGIARAHALTISKPEDPITTTTNKDMP